MEVASAIRPCRPSLQSSYPKTPFLASHIKTFQPSHLRCSPSSTRSVAQNQLQKSVANRSKSQFLHLGRPPASSTVRANAGAGAGAPAGSAALQTVARLLHLLVSLGIVLAVDKLLKKAFVAAAIKFPSALFGMFCVFSVLLALDVAVPAAAYGLMKFFEPATLFIQRWLPLFYVPSLVVLPLAVKDIPAASALKIGFILGNPWLLLLLLCLLRFFVYVVMHGLYYQRRQKSISDV